MRIAHNLASARHIFFKRKMRPVKHHRRNAVINRLFRVFHRLAVIVIQADGHMNRLRIQLHTANKRLKIRLILSAAHRQLHNHRRILLLRRLQNRDQRIQVEHVICAHGIFFFHRVVKQPLHRHQRHRFFPPSRLCFMQRPFGPYCRFEKV